MKSDKILMLLFISPETNQVSVKGEGKTSISKYELSELLWDVTRSQNIREIKQYYFYAELNTNHFCAWKVLHGKSNTYNMETNTTGL